MYSYRAFISSLFLIFLPLLGASQDDKAKRGGGQDARSSLSDISQGALRIAKHYPSTELAVHTYRVKKADQKELKDENGVNGTPSFVKPLLQGLRDKDSVQRATFDPSTATITVLSTHEAQLPRHLK